MSGRRHSAPPSCKCAAATGHKSNDTGISDDLVSGVRRYLPKKEGHLFSLDARGKLLAETLAAAVVSIEPVSC